MDKITVKFEPMGRQVEAEPGESVMAVAARENLPVRSDCGGKGSCGKCRVILDPPEHASALSRTESKTLSPRQLSENVRLACQARIQGPLTVTIPEAFMDSDAATGKRIEAADYALNPMVKRVYLPKGAAASRENAAGDVAAWVNGHLRKVFGEDPATRNPESLRQISLPAVTEAGVTVVTHKTRGITAVISGEAPRSLGLAVDIGTTSVAAYLCDLGTGRVVTSDSAANPQRRFGEDVISRISFACKDPGNTAILQRLAAETVSDLARRCAEAASVSIESIDEVTIVGNPTMEQVFYGAHPHNLGKAPFLPLTRKPVTLRAEDAGLSLNPGTPVYIFPVVSGFVGGDTLGAVLADRAHSRGETTLLVDIGTNGELVLGSRDGLFATSCATGPAFEGAQISCGMRAVPGAITRVGLDPASGQLTWEVMNGSKVLRPMGLCGSGIIDAIAALRRAGVILENGRFDRDIPGVICDDQGVGREFVLVPKEDAGTGAPITLTLGDIRQIQLAKAALALGIEYLTRRSNRAVDRIVLTGAFGARFDWRNAFAIGMLPPCVAGAKVLPMDNLAGVGAIRALMDGDARNEVEGLNGRIEHVDLAKEPDFHTGLSVHMAFPSPGDMGE
jgi:uncharacterized 2Fe-2S/4Fe-4S cluster protein (DUF4445 family)